MSEALRAEFLRLLIRDSGTNDRRRHEYNQAIFNPIEGWWAVFNGTDLDMVMSKFDKAVKNLAAIEPIPPLCCGQPMNRIDVHWQCQHRGGHLK